jgi:predicted ATP-dependent Lon-type protease
MKKEDKARSAELKSLIYDFFLVHFDEKTANEVKRHQDRSIQILKEYMSNTHIPRGRLKLYQEVIQHILELYTMEQTNRATGL